MKIGCFCPVWVESRYLPLVLEQMALCPGPKLLLWMDEPIFWYGNAPPPSGRKSRVQEIMKPYKDIIEIVDCQPKGPKGYLAINEIAFEILGLDGVEVPIRFDSDWLFTLEETKTLYAALEEASPTQITRWNVEARHYWRDWHTLYADTGIGVAYRIEDPDIWKHYEPQQYTKLDLTCHHPSYVLTDEECYLKVKAWMHAPEFEERDFLEKEWLAKDDSKVNPYPADKPLPQEIAERLKKHGAY